MKRIFGIILCVALILSSMAMAQGNDYEKHYDEPVEVSVACWWYGDRPNSTEKWIEDCKEKFNIELDIQNTTTETYPTILRTKLASEDLPDIVMVHDILDGYVCQDMPVEKDTFVDLSDMPNLCYYSQTFLDGMKRDGKLLYIPVNTAGLGVMYNKKVFSDLDITEIPSNLDEFIALMDKIKAAGIAPLAGSWAEPWSAQIVPMIASEQFLTSKYPTAGKEIYNPADNTSTKKAADYADIFRKIFSFSYDWYQKGYWTEDPLGSDATVACQMLANGTAAMFVTGSWEYSVAQSFCDEGVEIGYFPLPLNAPDEQLVISTTSGEGMCVNSKSEKIEAAKIALNYYYSPEMQEAVIAEVGGVPTNQEITAPNAFCKDMQAYINDPANCVINGYTFGTSIMPLNTSFNMADELTAVSAGLETPDELIEKIDTVIEEVTSK